MAVFKRAGFDVCRFGVPVFEPPDDLRLKKDRDVWPLFVFSVVKKINCSCHKIEFFIFCPDNNFSFY